MMYYYNDFYPYHMFGFGSIFMVIFWVLILYLIVKLFKGKHLLNNEDKSIEILKERYAKGEITKEQFESIKKDLK